MNQALGLKGKDDGYVRVLPAALCRDKCLSILGTEGGGGGGEGTNNQRFLQNFSPIMPHLDLISSALAPLCLYREALTTPDHFYHRGMYLFDREAFGECLRQGEARCVELSHVQAWLAGKKEHLVITVLHS